jgi:hypothetical protein
MSKKVNGKNKGNTYERKIANLLSERFQEYLGLESGFRRNSDSGSYFGGSNSSRTQTHSLDYAVFGDLVCPKNFLYVVECKHYKTPPSWCSFLDGSVKQWDEWLAQNDNDCRGAGLSGALIVKYNNVPDMVFLNDKTLPIRQCFQYRERAVYKLSDWLTLPDSAFFGQTVVSL